MKKIDKKSKMIKYGACAVLSAGMICGLVFANTQDEVKAEDRSIAAVGLMSVDTDAKEVLKKVEKVSTKKSAKKEVEKAETKTKETQESQDTTAYSEEPQQAPAQTQSEPQQTQSAAPAKAQTQVKQTQEQETPQPVQEAVTNPVAQTALSLVGSQMYCEEVAEASINAIGKSAWITKSYMDGDVEVIDDTMSPDNFLQVGYQVSLNNLQQGDILYYANNGTGGSHVAVYVGNGQAVHGGFNGKNVVVAGVYLSGASTPIGIRL